MEKPNIEEKIVEFIDKKLALILRWLSSSFYDSLNSFRYGFHKFKATFFIKVDTEWELVNFWWVEPSHGPF